MPQDKKLTNVNFSNRFRDLVERSGMTQKELAQSLGVSEGAMVNYKRGRIPKAEELVRISSFFGVSVDWLLLGKDDGGVKEDQSWRNRALTAEQKLDALKAAMEGWQLAMERWIKKI